MKTFKIKTYFINYNIMYLFVCLGNVGEEYDNTRHNVGFLIADKTFDHKNIELMSNFTHFLLSGIDYKTVKKARRNNFLILNKEDKFQKRVL